MPETENTRPTSFHRVYLMGLIVGAIIGGPVGYLMGWNSNRAQVAKFRQSSAFYQIKYQSAAGQLQIAKADADSTRAYYQSVANQLRAENDDLQVCRTGIAQIRSRAAAGQQLTPDQQSFVQAARLLLAILH